MQVTNKANLYLMNAPLMIELKCKQKSNGVNCGIFTIKNLEIVCTLTKYKVNMTKKYRKTI